MKTFYFKALLQRDACLENAKVTIDDEGFITEISNKKGVDHTDHIYEGFAIPGFQNAHSHAFQYAMAGLAELHTKGSGIDDFWGWRNEMYRLALNISPEQLEHIATMLYVEMLKQGYTNVAEFHYLHNDSNGSPYENRAELGSRLVAAASKAGIGITLIPVYYNKGGFGKAVHSDHRRFYCKNIDEYFELLDSSKTAVSYYQNANLAFGAHSMRAVDPNEIPKLLEHGPKDYAFHMHIAEQMKEVQEAKDHLGRRPVEWLLNNIELNERFNLVHATHMTDDETLKLARSKANVVLCPSTEGNLADGFFDLKTYLSVGGLWSIGTDSHVGLSPLEELRLLDYGQRLKSKKRDTFHAESGNQSFHTSLIAGRKAMNNYSVDYFKIGMPFNACVIDDRWPLISTRKAEKRMSTFIYAGNASNVLATIAHGKEVVWKGRHVYSEEISDDFVQSMLSLKR